MKNRILPILLFVFSQISFFGQSNCNWTKSVKKINANEYDLIFKVAIDRDWFIGSINQLQDSVLVPTKIWLDTSETFGVGGSLKESVAIKYFSYPFNANLLVHQTNATFTQRIQIKERKMNKDDVKNSETMVPKIRVRKEKKIKVYANIEYEICNDKQRQCSFPPTLKLDLEINVQ